MGVYSPPQYRRYRSLASLLISLHLNLRVKSFIDDIDLFCLFVRTAIKIDLRSTRSRVRTQVCPLGLWFFLSLNHSLTLDSLLLGESRRILQI